MAELPSIQVWLVVGYAVVLIAIAWTLDRLGERSAQRSASWRTKNFVYKPDEDAWKCHEDQWLWPASFDPDKRVIRYVGQHAICGRCPVKDSCSPTPGPREIMRPIDPWPHSEAGRFHRGIAVVIAAIAAFLPAGMLLGARTPADVIVLATTLVTVAGTTYPLAKHLWNTPANAPQILPHDETLDLEAEPGPDTTSVGQDIETLIDRYAVRWSSDRKRV